MLGWLKQARDRDRTARSLYGSIVTQARSRGFYAGYGVPDTREGRFEMIALHLVLALRRLTAAGQPGRRLGRALTEVFVADIDANLREMTVGDLAVPRQVKRAVAALRDWHAACGAACADAQEGRLAAAIEARLAGLPGAEHLDAGAICAYIGRANRALGVLPGIELLAGRIEWPRIGTLEQGVRTAAG